MDAIIFACVLVVSLQLAFFPLISSSLGMGKLNGVIGACFWLASKPRLVYGFEAMYAGALFALTCCVYRRFLDRDRGNAKLAWPLGILMGLLILTIPTVVPILAIWILREVWRYKFSFLKSAGLPLILLPTLIVAPWTIRNYSIFHRVVPVRDDLGLELSVSNNDCARFGIRKSESYGCFNNIHPNKSIIEARKVKAKGEVQYNDMRLRQALDWIRGHPARFSKLTAERFLAFWLPTETGTRRHYAGLGRRWERLIIYLMTLLSVAGIVILYRRDAESAMIYMLCLAIFPLVHYLIQFEYRYRYPIIWITFLLGALPITTCLARLGSNFFPRELAQLEESKLTANG